MPLQDAQIENITAEEAYARLRQEAAAQLIDVRTQAEWAFVGIPDLSEAEREPILIEWQAYPSMSLSPDFIPVLRDALERRGHGADAPLFFLCRSGGRSAAAARAAAQAGLGRCYNIVDGFEGPSDSSRHRGRVAGWKASDLPWVQS